MAPGCVDCCLSLPVLCVFVLFFSIVAPNVDPLLVHGGRGTLTPHLVGIPTHFYRNLAPLPRRKRSWRLGRRSGRQVNLKARLVRSSTDFLDWCLVSLFAAASRLKLLLAWMRYFRPTTPHPVEQIIITCSPCVGHHWRLTSRTHRHPPELSR